jgi:DNA repair protein RadC
MTMNHIETLSLFQVTEVELIYRNKLAPCDRPQIKSSSYAYELLMMAWDMNKIELLEQFKIILLDRRNSCIGISDISTGGVAGCLVDPKIVFSTALKARASSIVLSHNHPSGNLTPSNQDIALTRKFVEAGKLLDIEVIEHMIVTPHSYYSFADNGLLPH